MAMKNRQWYKTKQQAGNGLVLAPDDFGYREDHLPEPGEGQILVRNILISSDPMNHAWAIGMPELWARTLPAGFQRDIPVGAPLRAAAVGQVIRSNHPDFHEGTLVSGFWEISDYCVAGEMDMAGMPVRRVPESVSPATALSTLGMPGLCAFFGLRDIGQPDRGDSVLVSGASGAIGHVAAQIARSAGARVVGLAGGPERCRQLGERIEFDDVLDYQGDLARDLEKVFPNGIDVVFDNVGGPVLDLALLNLAVGARVVMCGNMTTYQGYDGGLHNTAMLANRRSIMGGILYFDYAMEIDGAEADLLKYLRDGKIRELHDVTHGFDSIPGVMTGLHARTGPGKRMIEITD